MSAKYRENKFVHQCASSCGIDYRNGAMSDGAESRIGRINAIAVLGGRSQIYGKSSRRVPREDHQRQIKPVRSPSLAPNFQDHSNSM